MGCELLKHAILANERSQAQHSCGVHATGALSCTQTVGNGRPFTACTACNSTLILTFTGGKQARRADRRTTEKVLLMSD